VKGRHRILLGMAAGVGKTYRMLNEGRQALDGEGRDVVIGFLEPHERPDTIAAAAGIERVPTLSVGADGRRLPELDLDAVLRREPELALVDELAHTNAPGLRNAKRYEDITELLDAGIDVISTVNVQHLESLNDAVAELTGVRVRETFPDSVLDRADEVVLVDLTPDALRRRIDEGKVYKAERATAALLNFFRPENLSGLRELALREVAEDVGARRQASILDEACSAAVAERVLALVTPHPGSQRIVRRAWRSAQRLAADLDVLWVRPPGKRLRADEETARAALRRLCVILGAHYLEEESDELVATVQRTVEHRGSTYVFLGTPDERRRIEIVRGSLVSALIRALPGVDLRVVANRVERREKEIA
jgi:two-component system sensor histidine kinase KdpD